ncbi:MAG: hypothetical protein IPK33_33370 [Gemmatimonadetes bacterium]|nr:hypothetical protein [Gemmatimonadota bacterium]
MEPFPAGRFRNLIKPALVQVADALEATMPNDSPEAADIVDTDVVAGRHHAVGEGGQGGGRGGRCDGHRRRP